MSGSATDAGRLLISVEATAEKLRQQLAAAEQAVTQSMNKMAAGASTANAAFESVSKAGENAAAIFAQMAGRISPIASDMAKLSTGALGIVAGVAAATGALLLLGKSIADAGDAQKLLIARMTDLTGSAEAAEAAYAKLDALAMQTGVSAEQSAGMFIKLSNAALEVGLTNKQVGDLVKTIEQAGIVSGASGQVMEDVAQSLSVGLMQGQMNARQFRTVLVEMPVLARAMADSLGLSVTAIMALAREGKLSATVISQGLGGAADTIAPKFEALPVSMSRAMGELNSGLGQFLISLDRAIGLSGMFAGILAGMASGLKNLQLATGFGAELEQANHDLSNAAAKVLELEATMKAVNARGSASTLVFGGLTPAQIQKQLDDANKAYLDAMGKRDAILTKSAAAESVADQKRAADSLATQQATDRAAMDKLALSFDARLAAHKKYDDQEKIIAKAETDRAVDAATVTAMRTANTKELDDTLARIQAGEDAHAKKLDAAAEKMQKVVDATARARDAAVALRDAQLAGGDATERANTQAEINNRLVEAGIPLQGRWTDAQKASAAAIAENVTQTIKAQDATKAAHEQAEKNIQAVNEYNRQLLETAKSFSNDISGAFYDALTSSKKGESFVDYFKGLFKKVAVAALSQNIVLPIVAPIVGSAPALFGVTGSGSSLYAGTSTALALSGSASGGVIGGGNGMVGGGGASAFGGLSNVLGLSSLSDSLGLSNIGGSLKSALGLGNLFGSTGGVGGFLGQGIFGTSLSEAATLSAGVGGAPVAATGLFGGASIGTALGGVGLGFGAGSLVNSLIGGHQLGGTIGAGLGSIAGFAVGGPVGALIGGVIGGVGGGLFGPGPKHQAWGVEVDTSNNQLAVTNAGGTDTAGLQTALQDAVQQITALNTLLSGTPGLTVSGKLIFGHGNDVSAAVQPPTFGEVLPRLTFAGGEGTTTATILAHQAGSVASVQALQDVISFAQTYDTLSKKTSAFDAQLQALNDSFEKAIVQATTYGLATDVLVSEQAKEVAALNAAHAAAIATAEAGPQAALLTAQGRTFEAATLGADVARAPAIAQLQAQLDDLGLSAADSAHYVDLLTQALDLQQSTASTANATARAQAELSLQATEAQMAGQTATATRIRQSIDDANSITSFRASLVALGETDDDVAASVKRLTDALGWQQNANAAAAAAALGSTEAAAMQKIFQTYGMGAAAQKVQDWLDQRSLQAFNEQLIALGASTAEAVLYTNLMRDALTAQSAAMKDATAATLRGLESGLGVRALVAAAGGATEQSELMAQAEAALVETKALADQLKGLGASADDTARLMAELEDTQGAERLAIIKKWTDQANAALSTGGAAIQQYIDKLTGTSAGGASPTDQLRAAQATYGTTLALAQTGNADALGQITGSADALIAAGKEMYGSGPAFAALIAAIETALAALPVVKAYNDQQTALLPHAAGGAFSGGRIVSVPTYQPLVQMGEAGPEAVIPLSRDRRGRLGIASAGGSGDAAAAAAIGQVGAVLRDELRAMRGDIADLRTTMRRVIAA